MYKLLLLSVIQLLRTLSAQEEAGDYGADLVTHLPDLQDRIAFTHYSGYLRVNDQRSFHYWLVESENNPDEDPLVLWLNGGPGCSSMDGMFTENGPFRVLKGGEGLTMHPQRWNKIANMLYLESPAGVGFSYSNTHNYTTSDDQVASDNYQAILSFYTKFPKYNGRKFYVTGESYAGIYIPTLLLKLMENPSINLQAAAIGNGYMKPDLLEDTKFPFWYYHGMISSGQWQELTDACCTNPNHTDCQFIQYRSEECQALVIKTMVSVMKVPVNPYNIYGTCDVPAGQYRSNSRLNRLVSLMLKQAIKPYTDLSIKCRLIEPEVLARFLSLMERQDMLYSKRLYKVKADIHALAAEEQTAPPCTDDTDLAAYLNRPDVQNAIHVRTDLPTWTLCSPKVSQDGPNPPYHRQYEDMSPQFKRILAGQVRLLVFNGDGDTVCNFYGDEIFVDELKLPEVSERGPWYYTSPRDGSRQIGGFAHQFEGLTFATVKGAGHMVPSDQPDSSYEMFSRFLSGVKL